MLLYQLEVIWGDTMRCHICDKGDRPAQGICQCGRFVCNWHSRTKNGKLLCTECYMDGQQAVYERIIELIKQIEQQLGKTKKRVNLSIVLRKVRK